MESIQESHLDTVLATRLRTCGSCSQAEPDARSSSTQYRHPHRSSTPHSCFNDCENLKSRVYASQRVDSKRMTSESAAAVYLHLRRRRPHINCVQNESTGVKKGRAIHRQRLPEAAEHRCKLESTGTYPCTQ
jgi:hypothetical protein